MTDDLALLSLCRLSDSSCFWRLCRSHFSDRGLLVDYLRSVAEFSCIVSVCSGLVALTSFVGRARLTCHVYSIVHSSTRFGRPNKTGVGSIG
ncbi:hypothetical protein BDW67DRAFT_78645 [Aspergillus spinulosporus]